MVTIASLTGVTENTHAVPEPAWPRRLVMSVPVLDCAARAGVARGQRARNPRNQPRAARPMPARGGARRGDAMPYRAATCHAIMLA